MKKCLYSFIILLLLIFVSSCDTPPIDMIETSNISEYLLVNTYTQEVLQRYYLGGLPSVEHIDISKGQYYYKYECSVFGDPNFIIYLKNYYDSNSFEREQARLIEISVEVLASNDGKFLYIMGGAWEEISAYCDDVINDGRSFNLEYAIANPDDNTIEFLTASVQDNYQKPEIIITFIDYYHKAQVQQGIIEGNQPE